ncbi:hypothetical protein P9F83_12530 [Peribacillus psychrosaccharolyticus]|uniref:hypothetical protein n=1 Tax=Peribacillus psychrosaccharolyticus TaxID=1407 RepID=UPI0002E28BCF|nr:hypothetical protein [Peribacillus psychrosaccharolyticus]MEC2056049.1 hypothetical protein [Peribacillus psychrosaccharolyticus]
MLKSSLYNLFNSTLTEWEKEKKYMNIFLMCTSNHGEKKYFPVEFIESIKNKNIDYLYGLGKRGRKIKKEK